MITSKSFTIIPNYRPSGEIDFNSFVAGSRTKRRKKLNIKKIQNQKLDNKKTQQAPVKHTTFGAAEVDLTRKNGTEKHQGLHIVKLKPRIKEITFAKNGQRTPISESTKINGVNVKHPDGYISKNNHYHKTKPWSDKDNETIKI